MSIQQSLHKIHTISSMSKYRSFDFKSKTEHHSGETKPAIGCSHYYRPQRSCGQGNIFTPVCYSFCSQCLPQCMLGYHPSLSPLPLGQDTPLKQTAPGTRHPPIVFFFDFFFDLFKKKFLHHHTPPPEADSGIRSTRGRYASYLNAFLFILFIS